MFLFKRFFASLLLFFVIINYLPSMEGYAETPFLETNRYKIFYKNEHAEYALNLASVIDRKFDNISRFIGYEPAERLNLHLAASRDRISNIVNINSTGSVYALEVFADYEHSVNLGKIHEFTVKSLLSDSASKESFFRRMRGAGLEGWISPSVSHYIIYGFDSRSSMYIRGVLQRGKRISINSEAATLFSESEIRSIQIGFIHFVKEYYGMGVLSFALKNISYYGSFQNALENITGLTGDAITHDFNSFYYNKYKKSLEQKDSSLSGLIVTDIDGRNLLATDMKGRILYSEKREKGAVLYILESAAGKDSRIEVGNISSSSDEVMKIDGAFIKGGGAAAAVTKRNGTLFLIFNMDQDKPDISLFIPYIFSRELSKHQLPGNLIFSASEGSRRDIFTLNTETMAIKRISDSKGYYRSPALSDKGRLYCIEGKSSSRIVEYSESAETFNIIAESKCVIDDLSVLKNGDFIFSCDDGVSNIHLYNRKFRRMIPLTDFRTGAFKPLLLNANNIIFNYYTGNNYRAAVIDAGYKLLNLQRENREVAVSEGE